MQNFRRHHRRPPVQALDGIIRGPQPARPQPSSPPRQLNNVFAERTRIDNFRRPGGYQSANSRIAVSQTSNPVVRPTAPAPSAAPRAVTPPKLSAPPATSRKKVGKKVARHPLRFAIRSAAALAAITIVLVGFMFGKGWLNARKVFKGDSKASAAALAKEVDPLMLKGEGDGRVNILILGKGGPNHDGGELTDTILVASIDPVQNEAALLSVPRDLYVKMPNEGSMKINAVYPTGKEAAVNKGVKDKDDIENAGIDAIEQQLEQTIGIPIHYYVMVDFDAFRQAIDTVGGVDVNVKTAVYDTNFAWQFGVLNVKPGEQHFDGKTALMYARSRYTSARGDFDRAARQREIMVALKEKILSLGTFSNPAKVTQLMDAFGGHVRTDLSLKETKRLYELGQKIDNGHISSLSLADPPHDFVKTANVGDQSVVVPIAGMYDYKAIQSYVRNSLKDSFLKNENATVVVLNGTDIAGLAGRTGEELKSYGYTVTSVGDAPTKTYTDTQLIDMTGTKKYTKNYLQQRFKLTAQTKLPDTAIQANGADFVIILGQNETSRTSN